MPLFPKIQSACPYKSRLADIMDGDVCRMCKRQVFDLTAMTDERRVAFLAGCEESVCVSYSLPVRRAARAAAVAVALALPAAAAAQEEIMIIVGGINAPSSVKMVDVPDDIALPELPVLYEEEGEVLDEGASSEGAKDEPPAAQPSQD
ncbi:hypothetical protein [Allosphingosinicella sp.]|jgi:hypothetical protein|uniref:hypothetical protein n=1 Tax=Allosphingosinicella sp. TaxID=2823234 RepID=UPI002F1AC9E9